MSEAEVDRLPEPDLFRDAVFLSGRGMWSPRDLDETDALVFALIRMLQQPRRT